MLDASTKIVRKKEALQRAVEYQPGFRISSTRAESFDQFLASLQPTDGERKTLGETCGWERWDIFESAEHNCDYYHNR